MDPLFRWFFGLLCLITMPWAALGGHEAWKTQQELESQVRARGTVVDNRLVTQVKEGQEEQYFLPVVEYQVPHLGRVRFTDKIGSLPADFPKGAAVEVSYSEQSPFEARILSWKRLWLGPCLLLTIGLLPPLVVGLLLLKLSRQAVNYGSSPLGET